MSENFIITTSNLTKQFNDRTAVSELNLNVLKGQIYGFLGPNGAGKSTTIRMLLNLIRPTSGSLALFGKPASIHSRKRIGALIEAPDFYNYLSGYRNIKMLSDLSGGASDKTIYEALEIVKLDNRANDKVKNYSHGMKQRLGIAQALVSSPELLILDEPTTSLDPEGIKEVRDLIQDLANDLGLTVFLSSHQLHEVEQVCTHMGIIDHGKMIVQGEVQNILRDTNFFITEVAVDQIEKATELLIKQSWITQVTESAGLLKVKVMTEDRPRMVELLVSNGINVSSVIPRTHLEDFYLSLVDHRGKI